MPEPQDAEPEPDPQATPEAEPKPEPKPGTVADPGTPSAAATPSEAGASPLPPALPLAQRRRLLCMVVRQLAAELLAAVGRDGEHDQHDRNRRSASHVRQIAMYVCHVAYSMPMADVGAAFGRDRSTVSHACRMVEQRRDDPAYDRFVAIVERMACAVFLVAGTRF